MLAHLKKLYQYKFNFNLMFKIQVKLEPGLLQEIPRRAAGPLKVEIHDSLLDSGAMTKLPP